ncbi:hypothetical protein WMY93_031889 [Mugilogobius chulae]|uniref:Secreted protein n=1 Tax=Mugilogobius chulae TaxID=88201 RepID=A0AAW0MCS0_9GOBI
MTVCKACACAVSGVIAALRTRLNHYVVICCCCTGRPIPTEHPRPGRAVVRSKSRLRGFDFTLLFPVGCSDSVSGVNLQLSNHISHLDQHSKPDLSKFTVAVRDKGRNTDTDGESDCQSMKTTCLEEERDKERDERMGPFTSRFHCSIGGC